MDEMFLEGPEEDGEGGGEVVGGVEGGYGCHCDAVEEEGEEEG